MKLLSTSRCAERKHKTCPMAAIPETIDPSRLADNVLEYLSEHIETHYRIAVLIVGPPGSGKSTVSAQLCNELNARYQEYFGSKNTRKAQLLQTFDATSQRDFLCRNIPVFSAEDTQKAIGPSFDHIEDLKFKPHRFQNIANDSEIIVSRGGLSNSIRIAASGPRSMAEGGQLAQIVPMDGFHLSREHLDHFSNPQEAHNRRGSPETFDSNNCLQLCRILAESCQITPPVQAKWEGELFDKINSSFSDTVPSIYIPGFDHALKDPTMDEHCVDASTRIIVIEGLYLLLNEENWKDIYPAFKKTNAVLVWKLDLPVDELERRVAKRHVESGLAPTLESGINRFRENDFMNAIKIREQSIEADDILTLSNI
ncbi:LADA_0F06436g1_1 [Lachancea dasiensis]|uniref:LADA_0F06436g1_1 n=1 Tax=Lachancea dasiensis TaxID=1072105 RepID=A0A1G4JJZ9_9SACH|nr:LADA_0F06436g1_1 [Lachancea dasiensis]